MIAIDELGFYLLRAEQLVLIAAAITQPRLATERDDFAVAAFALVKREAVCDFAATHDLADFLVHNRTDGMNPNKAIPILFKNFL